MVVDASMLQLVSTLHVVVTMLSVCQEHTATARVCEAYSTIAVDRCTTVYFLRFLRLQLPLLLCCSVHFVLVSVSLQLSRLILTAKFSDDCVIH